MPKKRKHLRGTLEKVIKSNYSPEKAQISIHEAEDLYREIRVENELTDGGRAKASLKQAGAVDLIVDSDSECNADEANNGRQKQHRKTVRARVHQAKIPVSRKIPRQAL